MLDRQDDRSEFRHIAPRRRKHLMHTHYVPLPQNHATVFSICSSLLPCLEFPTRTVPQRHHVDVPSPSPTPCSDRGVSDWGAGRKKIRVGLARNAKSKTARALCCSCKRSRRAGPQNAFKLAATVDVSSRDHFWLVVSSLAFQCHVFHARFENLADASHVSHAKHPAPCPRQTKRLTNAARREPQSGRAGWPECRQFRHEVDTSKKTIVAHSWLLAAISDNW